MHVQGGNEDDMKEDGDDKHVPADGGENDGERYAPHPCTSSHSSCRLWECLTLDASPV
jgi:hypothetical protein